MRAVLVISALVAILGAVFVVAIGRAVDQNGRTFIMLTRDGVTLECERITDVVGRTFYDSCVRVP